MMSTNNVRLRGMLNRRRTTCFQLVGYSLELIQSSSWRESIHCQISCLSAPGPRQAEAQAQAQAHVQVQRPKSKTPTYQRQISYRPCLTSQGLAKPPNPTGGMMASRQGKKQHGGPHLSIRPPSSWCPVLAIHPSTYPSTLDYRSLQCCRPTQYHPPTYHPLIDYFAILRAARSKKHGMGQPSGMDGMVKAWHGHGCAGVQCTVSPAARWSINLRGTTNTLHRRLWGQTGRPPLTQP